jgi:hypothetical protein
MSKGNKKTILERQLSTYNGFLYEIRQADRLGNTRKMPVTTAEIIANNILIARDETAQANKKRIIDEMIANKPITGNTRGLSAERVKEMATEYTAWNTAYHKLIKSLN